MSKFKTTDLGLIIYYLKIEVSQQKITITIIQIVYINQLLETHQLSNCNLALTLIVKKLYLTLIIDNFVPDLKDVLAYK